MSKGGTPRPAKKGKKKKARSHALRAFAFLAGMPTLAYASIKQSYPQIVRLILPHRPSFFKRRAAEALMTYALVRYSSRRR